MTIIAIDGPAASGKGTIARRLASEFGMAHLDSGLLYRAVALGALKKNLNETNVLELVEVARAITHADLTNPALRDDNISRLSSRFAVIPEVRHALISYQKSFAKQKCGAVVDGRDIGTVICPDADLKFFITASPKVRAERRYRELVVRGKEVEFDGVLAEVIARDKRDCERQVSPLKPAESAVIIDNSSLDAEATYQLVRNHCLSLVAPLQQ